MTTIEQALINGIFRIANECNCRAEHGAEGAEHLLAIERMLRALVLVTALTQSEE